MLEYANAHSAINKWPQRAEALRKEIERRIAEVADALIEGRHTFQPPSERLAHFPGNLVRIPGDKGELPHDAT